jgi:hypothetical protein
MEAGNAYKLSQEGDLSPRRPEISRSHPKSGLFSAFFLFYNHPESLSFLWKNSGVLSLYKGKLNIFLPMRCKNGPQRACPTPRGTRADLPQNLRATPIRPGTHTKTSNPSSHLGPKPSLGAAPYPPMKVRGRQSGANQPPGRTAPAARTLAWDLKKG